MPLPCCQACLLRRNTRRLQLFCRCCCCCDFLFPHGDDDGDDDDDDQVGSEPEIMNAFMASLEEAQSVGVYTQKQALLYIGTKMRVPPKAGARAMRQQSS